MIAGSIARPIRRIADATRALAADERHEPLPKRERARSPAREGVQRDGRAARRLARGRAQLPALGQPRAEDAADRDPRLRRRAGRRSIRAGGGGARDRGVESGPAGTARARPARPRAHEPERVLGAARAGRPRRGRPRDGAAARAAAKQFGVDTRRRRRRGVGRGRRGPVAADRVEPRRERAARDACRRQGDRRCRAGPAERRRHRARDRRRRPPARLRALLPLRQGRQGPSGRQRARPGDRAAARPGDGRRRSASRAAPAGRRSWFGYGRSFEVSTTSKSDPCNAPSACSWSFDHFGLGAPETYQFEPLSATIIPYVFIA